ncbi:expressed unknown protein [Seminavis robusta]|uniref:Uncharacterized protein n=1 Tax=Seminavis robusta TaxID=568900 RepID=A0A9N8H8H4_9STRA|nr:expressed unknown protein [Seminavis robusta]|eukprot:Sro217_g089710.1 n/a (172) ;mRNA; r:39433-39948
MRFYEMIALVFLGILASAIGEDFPDESSGDYAYDADAIEAAMKSIIDCDNAMGLDEDSTVEGAEFSHQGLALVNVTTWQGYCDWWSFVGNGPLVGFSVDARDIGYDEEDNAIVYAATITATHTGEGMPFPPTNMTTISDYAYWALLDDDYKIVSVKKIWNDFYAMTELGWI